MVIKSALLGCGRMGAFTSDSVKKFSPKCWLPLSHAESIKNHKNFRLAYACDLNKNLLEKVKRKYQISYVYENYLDMISNNIDFISIATRTPNRAKIIEDALNQDINIIHTEKPLCNSVSELNNLDNQLSDDEKIITYGTVRRHMKIYRKARDYIRNGKLGKLISINLNMGFGGLFWMHPHTVDLGLFFAPVGAKPVSVYANFLDINRKGNKIYNDPKLLFGYIKFDNDVVVNISAGSSCDVDLICEGGQVTVSNDGEKIIIKRSTLSDPYMKKQKEIKVNYPFPEGTYSILRLINKSIQNKNFLEVNLLKKDILLNQRILFLLIASNLYKRELDINFQLDDINILAQTNGMPA